ncbi:MAG: beta-ketoacyl-[acyl-carrier-protein] synthase family protein [candidate division FCPU426 bacterium]
MNSLSHPALDRRSDRAVVITGLGAVTGLGPNAREFWRRLIAAESAVGPVASFDATEWRTHLGCEIREALPETGHPDRVYDLAVSACREAVEQAGGTLPAERTAVVIGTLQGGILTLEQAVAGEIRQGRPLDILATYPVFILSSLSRYIASLFGFRGPVATPCPACASSGTAISRAGDLIRLGYADAVVTGGADAFSQDTFSGFNAMRSAAATACRPFSPNREGLVIGEGSGILILEARETALARGAKPLAVLAGTGLSDDAHHITAPDPEGKGAELAMRAALADAGLPPERIDYINTHGTGTPQNDRMETLAVKRVFGERARRLPLSSIKAAVGHCMGAAGAVEAVASVLTLLQGMLPPTLNFTPGDPECDLDYVPNQARLLAVKTVLSNSFGFAGNNVSLIFGLEGGK